MLRRKLFKTAAVVALAAGLAPDAAADLDPGDTIDVDLAILGAGAAGLTAACTALENGAGSVLVLEKEPLIGGSSVISRGSWAVSRTVYQASMGVRDTDNDFISDIMAEGEGMNDPRLVAAMVRYSRAQYEWFSAHGVAPYALTAESGAARIHRFSPIRLVFTLRKRALELGASIWVSSEALGLAHDGGRVTGVVFSRAGRRILCRTRHGVAICTGGFARNRTLVGAFAPRMSGATTISAQGSYGQGLLMAAQLGAGLADMDQLKASYAFPTNPSSIDDKTMVSYCGALIVNKLGKRFTSESQHLRIVADAALRQPSSLTYLVFDEAVRRVATALEPDKAFWRELQEGSTPSCLFRGSSVEETARKALLDPVALAETVASYNKSLRETGKDAEFHRAPLPASGGRLLRIDEPPFYVMPASACLVGTYCGLRIDDRARVLSREGKPFEGLWAAGEVAGGMHGANPLTGAPLASAFAFGRIAGLSATGGNKA